MSQVLILTYVRIHCTDSTLSSYSNVKHICAVGSSCDNPFPMGGSEIIEPGVKQPRLSWAANEVK